MKGDTDSRRQSAAHSLPTLDALPGNVGAAGDAFDRCREPTRAPASGYSCHSPGCIALDFRIA
ncbi:hypothetical protein MesoLjLa_21550 [Mesorhizobium sp. L-2-11]|nr:hypothetical protein MesoLjLa_21550 [Mesorhizobium sp. L-2-11]